MFRFNRSSQTNPPHFPRWLAITAASVTGLLVIAGIIITIVLVRLSHQAKTVDGTNIISQIEQYPQSYINAGLPQYPGANITQFGDSQATPKDHIVVYATTADDLTAVAQFYDDKMKQLGWQAEPVVDPDGDSTIHNYKKDTQEYSATIIRDNAHQRTNVLITWSEN